MVTSFIPHSKQALMLFLVGSAVRAVERDRRRIVMQFVERDLEAADAVRGCGQRDRRRVKGKKPGKPAT